MPRGYTGLMPSDVLKATEIPAEKVPRDNGPDAQSPQLQYSGVPAKGALLEIIVVRGGVLKVVHA